MLSTVPHQFSLFQLFVFLSKNVKNAKKVTKDFNKVGKSVADFTGEPAAKVTTGKIEFDKETGF